MRSLLLASILPHHHGASSQPPQSWPSYPSPCRICGPKSAIYRDHGQQQWFSENAKNGEIKHTPTQCATCCGDGIPPTRPETPSPCPKKSLTPALPPRSDTPPSFPTPSPTRAQPQGPGAPSSSPTPTPDLPLLGGISDVAVARLVRNNQILRGLLANSERKQHLAKAATTTKKGALGATPPAKTSSQSRSIG